MSTKETSAWKILPKYFFNCNNIDKHFISNHRILSNKEISLFYNEIHTQWGKWGGFNVFLIIYILHNNCYIWPDMF